MVGRADAASSRRRHFGTTALSTFYFFGRPMQEEFVVLVHIHALRPSQSALPISVSFLFVFFFYRGLGLDWAAQEPAINMDQLNAALVSIKVLRSSVGQVFESLGNGIRAEHGEEGRETKFLLELQELLNSVNVNLR